MSRGNETIESWLRELADRVRRVGELTAGASHDPRLHRSELARALAAVHLALSRITWLDVAARPAEARRALALLRRLPAPLGDASWPAAPHPPVRELIRLYAGLTAAQRAALLGLGQL